MPAGRYASRNPGKRGRPTGLLGGSFNPAHRGHRAISLFALDALVLDEVWWLVSPGNPLKSRRAMAPLSARLRSALAMARRAPIRPTAVESLLGTRYTVETISKLKARYPSRQFIWIMGADNLAQFHRWKDWRRLARMIPIAVVARPGYDGKVRAAPAMAWLGRFVRRSDQSRKWTDWSSPALVRLRFRPDPSSATAIRAKDPNWHDEHHGRRIRDPLTRQLLE